MNFAQCSVFARFVDVTTAFREKVFGFGDLVEEADALQRGVEENRAAGLDEEGGGVLVSWEVGCSHDLWWMMIGE